MTSKRNLAHGIISLRSRRPGWRYGRGIIPMPFRCSGQALFQFTNDNQSGPDTSYASINHQLTPGTITAVAWSEDGQYVAVTDANGNIHLLSDIVCSCFQQMSEFQAHPQQINAISWASNGLKFATASNDRTVQTWNVVVQNQTNSSADVKAQHLQTFTASAPVQTVAWSPNGQLLLYGDSAGNVGLWQVR